MNFRLLAFDLDGTVLRNDKTLSPATLKAIYAAHEKGVLIVPTTGRMFSGLPDIIKQLPLDYCIVGNGSSVFDVKTGRSIADIPVTPEDALEIFRYCPPPVSLHGIYQCDVGYMPAEMLAKVGEYMKDDFFPAFLRKVYTPVESMEKHFLENRLPVHKVNLYFKTKEQCSEIRADAAKHFPNFSITSSVPQIVEFTNINAHKGNALKLLCSSIGIDIADTAAFGDGGNDLTLIRDAGMGVAMGNAIDELKQLADYITLTNEEDGVAAVINRLLNEA